MEPPHPLISIVIPVHNGARFLRETLESVRHQSEANWECIVVDDGSTDDTVTIGHDFASNDGRFRIMTQPNRGASAARNAGFRASDSRAPYVTFMDADDLWLPHALGTLRERLERSPSAIGAHGLAETVDEQGAILNAGSYSAHGRLRLGRRGRRLVVLESHEATDFDVLINGNVLFPPGLLLARRHTYLAAGPFDEALTGAEDWDMLIRLSRFGHIEFIDEVLLLYRRHDRNMGAVHTIPQQAWFVRCKAFHSLENSAQQKRAAIAGWRAYQVLMIEEAYAAAVAAARERHARQALKQMTRIVAFTLRYARGWPHPRVRSAPLRW